MRVRIWRGYRAAHKDEFVWVEFDGEEVGVVREGTETREKQTIVYRASDGRYVIHEVIRSLLQDEETARVWFFPSIDKARECFGWVLEAVGLHPSRRAMMETFEEWD